jgi:hypothetical protein
MSIKIFDIENDSVIRSTVGIGKTTYDYALKKLCPLIDRLDIQRNQLASKMYTKMQEDISDGAILPPITLAFVKENVNFTRDNIEVFIKENISEGFILDGIQRLSAIRRIDEELNLNRNFNKNTTLYVNIVISPSKDTLLYRMITLNNGQKPMSPRHQIEALSNYTLNFDSDVLPLHTEKNQKRSRSIGFKKSDIIKAYIAYMSNDYRIDNKKIIESKMDELLVDKIITNKKKDNEEEFEDVLHLIARLSDNENVYKWFTFENNMIGFCSGVRASYNELANTSNENFEQSLNNFETYFNEWLDRSRIKIGTERRRSISNFINNYKLYKDLEPSELVDALVE